MGFFYFYFLPFFKREGGGNYLTPPAVEVGRLVSYPPRGVLCGPYAGEWRTSRVYASPWCRRFRLLSSSPAGHCQPTRLAFGSTLLPSTNSSTCAPSGIANGPQSRRVSSDSRGSSALFLPRQTAGTWAHRGPLQATVPHGCLWSRHLTDIFSFLATSFSLAPSTSRTTISARLVLPHERRWRRGQVPCGAMDIARAEAGKSPLMTKVQDVFYITRGQGVLRKCPRRLAQDWRNTLGSRHLVGTTRGSLRMLQRKMTRLVCVAFMRRSYRPCLRSVPPMETNSARDKSFRRPIRPWRLGSV